LRRLGAVAGALASLLLAAAVALAAPKVVIISLDGATPRFVDQYLASGALEPGTGLGLLRREGLTARQSVTISPSLTAPGHIAIATGSSAANNDIVANTFHLVASPFLANISGFAAPIGGYSIDGPAPSPEVTAEPLWLPLRVAGKVVLAATFPGADGLDVRVPGVPTSPIVQPAAERTADYTVPFGAFAGLGAQGFSLTATDFGPAPATTVQQLAAAGRASFSPVRQKVTALEQVNVGGVSFAIHVAALDTTDDGQTNYDTLVFFDAARGILPGPFTLPSTGPAYVRAADNRSSLFYLEGSSSRAGTGFYVSRLAPDLSAVRIARYSANAIPRNLPVLADVDDINAHVGFWAPQPDFRIPERLSPGFGPFPDLELEAIYQDLVRLFVDYQVRVGLRAIARFPDADLVMIYIEQPDGSGHQFLLTDPRQPTDFTNPASIGAGQDAAKVARYASYVESAYREASGAVQRVIEAVGTDGRGVPRSNVIVVSDHGFEAFHTAVSMNNFLASRGFDPTEVRAITSGPAVNIYINLQGREANGSVSRQEYVGLQAALVEALKAFRDENARYTGGRVTLPVFDKVYARPLPAKLDDPSFGRGTDQFIGQDSGDVFALLAVGYNFDGTQSPVVQRLGDPAAASPILSLPNFYGAHGYDPTLASMSAVFMAAGPDIRPGTLTRVGNIDVAPTVARLLGVKLSNLVEGTAIPVRIPRRVKASLLAQLESLRPHAVRDSAADLAKAVERVTRALAPPLWVDDAHLDRLGARVFQEQRAAVDHLLRIAGSLPSVREILEGFVSIDEELAAIAIDEAAADGGDERLLGLARQALNKGMAEASSGRHRAAIDQYRNAWGLADRAGKARGGD
jgi:predicted AlkP superfamily pyrophosphatase or phosphodiesterase